MRPLDVWSASASSSWPCEIRRCSTSRSPSLIFFLPVTAATAARSLRQPFGLAPAARGIGRLALVGLLFLPPVRGWFAAAGLDWAYLAALAWAVAFFGVPVVRRVAFALGVLDAPAARKVHRTPTPLLGGDTVSTPGPLTLSLTALGEVPQGEALLRSGAKPGDDIWVSGTLGDAALGLAVLQGRLDVAEPVRSHLIQRYRLPRPRLALGQALRGRAHAAIDISDGLLADLGHIVEDVEELCSRMAIIDRGEILLEAQPSRAIDDLRGRIWRRTVRQDELPALEQEHSVISTRLLAGRTIAHVYSDEPPGPEFEIVEPDMKDVYFSVMAGHRGRRRMPAAVGVEAS